MKWLFNARNVQIQKGGQGNVQNIGVPHDRFIQEMQRKDDDIKRLIADKEALKDQLHIGALERQTLARDLADLRSQHEGLKARLANPAAAYAEHQQRSSQIEQLLHDAASDQSIGQSRIRSALEAFKSLEYDEIDALLAETEQSGILIAADAAYGRGLIAEEAVKWHDAYTHYKRAATLSDDLTHLKALAHMTWRLGKTDESLQVQQRLVDAAKQDHGDQSPEYATNINNLANVMMVQGQYKEAEVLFFQVLEIDRKTIGEDHPEFSTHLNNFARAVSALGRHGEAEVLYVRVLEIDRKTIGIAHPEYAKHFSNLAGVVRAQGRHREAELLYTQALEIARKIIGETHPEFANYLNNLAGVVQDQGRHCEAEALYTQALEIARTTIGEAHPDFAIYLNNLAGVVQDQGRHSEAEALYLQALEIDRKTIGEAHPEYAKHLDNLAGAVFAQGRLDEAALLNAQALRIVQTTLGNTHPNTLSIARNYLVLLETQNTTSPSPETTAKIASLKGLLAP